MRPGLFGNGLRNAVLRQDVPAGLAVAAVALPSAIAYPAIAGLPPVVGIYSSIVPLVAYAVFGPSRRLMVGPDAATMMMLSATLTSLTIPGDRVLAASAIAVMVGLFCLAARLAHFGVVANFLSRPILVGFMAGTSLSILAGQIGRVTGVKLHAERILPPLFEVVARWAEINWLSLLLAVAMFVLLQVLRGTRYPGPVVVVVVSIVLSALFGFDKLGIAVVGTVPNTLPTLSMPAFHALPFKALVLDSGGLFLVSFAAGIVTARSFGAVAGEDVDPDRELVGFGAANIANGLFGGFPITASDSRTAINLSSGGTSQVAGLVAAAALAATLLFLGGALALLPIPALGAILVSAAISLIDIPALRQLWKISRMEFGFAIITATGTISFGVLNGVVVALFATLAYLVIKSMTPREALYGRIPGRDGFYKLHRHADARPVPGLTLVSVEGSVVFYNADSIRERLEAIARQAPKDARWFVLDASTTPHVDSTAAEMFGRLRTDLAACGVTLGFAELHTEVRRLLRAAGVLQSIGKDMLFDDIEEIEPALRRKTAGAPDDDG
jgi:SulP family sulfate permease